MSKYASLPDLDISQDIYETPDLADDISTLPTASIGPRTSSPTSDPDENRHNHDIDRNRLNLHHAKEKFEYVNVDAREVDFSDRISSKRKSYIVSARQRKGKRKGGRRVRKILNADGSVEFIGDGGLYVDEEGHDEDDSDGEIEESLDKKLARLRREVEEVKVELQVREEDEMRKREEAKARKEAGEEGEVGDFETAETEKLMGLKELSSVLESLQTPRIRPEGFRNDAEATLVTKLASAVVAPPTADDVQGTQEATGSFHPAAVYTVHYTPAFKKHHALAKAADFDNRITILEKVLGVNSSFLANLDRQLPNSAIIPALDDMARQISVLTSTNAPYVESLTRRVRNLTEQAEKLTESRRAARTAALEARRSGATISTGTTALLPSTNDTTPGIMIAPSAITDIDSSEREAKINALYGTLPTIEQLGPLLPPVLDRLRSLRHIHTEAGRAAEGLSDIERTQEEMSAEIKKWRDALEKLEAAMKDSEGTIKDNMEKVEGWVKEIEAKVIKLG